MHENIGKTEHIVEYKTYAYIWMALITFTGVTVIAAGMNLGNWTVFVALAIASIKGLMVMNVFMHLKFEDKVFKIFAMVAFAILMIFLGGTMNDFITIRW
ncbi:MAG TPA: cytochrome C oxidase subunit IV family protein [Bacteroidota bacterium]|nr:cytochrome C oxidase subunit IV family protein [Bacteroidota bacterium]